MNEILKCIKLLNTSFDCSTSFLDVNLYNKLNSYIKKIYKLLVKISNSQITLDESLDKLINKYKSIDDNQIREINKLNNKNIK